MLRREMFWAAVMVQNESLSISLGKTVHKIRHTVHSSLCVLQRIVEIEKIIEVPFEVEKVIEIMAAPCITILLDCFLTISSYWDITGSLYHCLTPTGRGRPEVSRHTYGWLWWPSLDWAAMLLIEKIVEVPVPVNSEGSGQDFFSTIHFL